MGLKQRVYALIVASVFLLVCRLEAVAQPDAAWTKVLKIPGYDRGKYRFMIDNDTTVYLVCEPEVDFYFEKGIVQVYKFADSGSIVWHRDFWENNGSYPLFPQETDFMDPPVFGIDSSNNLYLGETYSEEIGGYPIGGQGLHVLSLNELGERRWVTSSQTWDAHLYVRNMLVAPDGSVFFGGSRHSEGSPFNSDMKLWIVERGGQPIREVGHVTGQSESSGSGIAFDKSGNILEAGTMLVKFSPSGQVLASAGYGYGAGTGGCEDWPFSVFCPRLDSLGDIYVYGYHRIYKFDSTLAPLQVFDLEDTYGLDCMNWFFVYDDGSMLCVGNTTAVRIRLDGSATPMSRPASDFETVDVQSDDRGNIYVLSNPPTSFDVPYITSLDSTGAVRWDVPAYPGANFTYVPANSYPQQIEVDGEGDVYTSIAHTIWVSDTLVNRYVVLVRYVQPKTILIRDSRGDPIPNTNFSLIRVSQNGPVFSEDTLGQFVTDGGGQFELPPVGAEGYELAMSKLNPEADTLRVGDTLKVAKLVYAEPATRHSTLLGAAYSVHFDNGRFLPDGRLAFDTCKHGYYQEITLDHTECGYNLLASLEWDASELYLQGLMADFKQMSNYLYDVSDGQVRLDTVVIMDDRSLWNEADIRITASNVYWPNAGIMGIAWSGFPPITMPRKWFGDPDSCRIFSYLLHPLLDEVSDNYRTMGHELGHYGLGFSDEYLFVDASGNPLPEASRCSPLPAGNYGFMDFQYDRPPTGGVRASEMSSEYRYQSGACQNTAQWFDNGRLCWDDLERWAEGPRDGIYVPILKPSVTDSTERITPTGLNYFPGPNDDLYNLDYDVGRLVHFPAAVLPPDPSIQSIHLKVDTVVPGGLNVQLLRRGASPVYQIDQGTTTDNGQLLVLGMDFYQDEILVAGSSRTESLAIKSASGRAGARKTWMCGSVRPGSGVSRMSSRASASATGDSVTLSLSPVAGDCPMVCDGQLSDNGWMYGLWFDRALSHYPQLDIVTDQGNFVTSIFTAGTNSYGSPVAEYLTVPGKATIWAVDDSSSTFFFSTPFEVTDITAPKQQQKLIGPAGEAIVRIDSLNASIQRTMILSSAYPVPMNGLDPDAMQAGRTHSLSAYPADLFLGSNSLSLSYSDNDLKDQNRAVLGDEASLRIFRWDHGVLQWELVGGYSDTTLNTVTASISQSGVYGAFTTVVTCCKGRVGDANGQGTYPQEVTIGDILTLVTAKYISALPCEQTLPCLTEADVNQSGGANPKCSDVTMADIQTLVNHLFIAGPVAAPLKECLGEYGGEKERQLRGL